MPGSECGPRRFSKPVGPSDSPASLSPGTCLLAPTPSAEAVDAWSPSGRLARPCEEQGVSSVVGPGRARALSGDQRATFSAQRFRLALPASARLGKAPWGRWPSRVRLYLRAGSRAGRPSPASQRPASAHRSQAHTEHRARPPYLFPAKAPRAAQAPQPSRPRSGLPTAEDAFAVVCTHSCPFAFTHAQPAARAHAVARLAAPRARAHTSPHAFSQALPVTLFFPPNGSCRIGGPAAPPPGGKFPRRVATSSCWEHIWLLKERRAEEVARLPSQPGVQRKAPKLPECNRNPSLSLAPPPLTGCLQK